MNKIDVGFEKVECIAHIADVHIRNLRRHKEYKQVFRKLYKDLKDNLPSNSLIYLAGDIAHAKTEMSPELIEMTSDLFTKLSKIAPTILIGFLLHFCINWSIYIERMNAAQIRPLSTTSTTTAVGVTFF